MIKILINHFLRYEFGYIVLLISLISLYLSIVIKKKILKSFCLIVVGMSISVFIIELILSLNMGSISALPAVEYSKLEDLNVDKIRQVNILNVSDKMFFDVNTPINKTGADIVFDVILNVYSNGFRYTKANIDSDEAYVFLGCSNTFGHGVNDNETLPYYFSQFYNFNKNVVNCGQGGRGINTAINILQSDVLDSFVIKDTKIKYFIYSMLNSHFNRNFKIASYESANDNYVMENGFFKRVPQPFGIFKILFAKSFIFNRLFLNIIEEHNEFYYQQYMIDSFIKLNDIIQKKYKSKLIIIIWPEVNKDFIGRLKKTKLDLILLPDSLNDKDYIILNDGHPNAKANKKISAILLKYIEALSS
ncbi:MAG: hypothetical protein PHT84_06995 [Candidatus Pacebacteria bacterium]|jgi:hypothetical protein|nr:hypothetical protein [Candidatus Paceibacterota bacterium]